MASVTQNPHQRPGVTCSTFCPRSTQGGSRVFSPVSRETELPEFFLLWTWVKLGSRVMLILEERGSCSYGGARKSTTQRKLNRDWIISGFGSWKWCWSRILQAGVYPKRNWGTLWKKCHLINSSRNQGCFNLKSKAFRSHTIPIFKEKVVLCRSISRFSFSFEIPEGKTRTKWWLNSREADFIST